MRGGRAANPFSITQTKLPTQCWDDRLADVMARSTTGATHPPSTELHHIQTAVTSDYPELRAPVDVARDGDCALHALSVSVSAITGVQVRLIPGPTRKALVDWLNANRHTQLYIGEGIPDETVAEMAVRDMEGHLTRRCDIDQFCRKQLRAAQYKRGGSYTMGEFLTGLMLYAMSGLLGVRIHLYYGDGRGRTVNTELARQVISPTALGQRYVGLLIRQIRKDRDNSGVHFRQGVSEYWWTAGKRTKKSAPEPPAPSTSLPSNTRSSFN